MANKKITELNEATSVSGNDWLVIVDVANDETKKVHANQVGGNIPIQDTAPQDPEEDDLWIDTSEEGFDNSNVVNEYSESATDVYSCDYVNEMDKYSTTETKTNKVWIDGKPIYRKVIEKTYSSNMVIGDNSFNHNISNINEIINYDTIFILGWDTNTYTSESYLAKNNIGVRINKTQIVIESGQAWNGTFKFIVEYTKTTD